MHFLIKLHDCTYFNVTKHTMYMYMYVRVQPFARTRTIKNVHYCIIVNTIRVIAGVTKFRIVLYIELAESHTFSLFIHRSMSQQN